MFQIFDPKNWNLPQPLCLNALPAVPFLLPASNHTEVSDSIPWHRPFFWSPTCWAEAAEALRDVLELIGHKAVEKRTRIAYAGDPEPTFVQHILIRARDCGYVGEQEPLPFVLVPGYDAGAGFYFRVISHMARLGFDVYGVDLLGHGLSSRPRFDGKTREEGEAFYTDAIEEWRKAQGLDNFVLMGHSFGGYVSGCYALAHQEHVRRLILVGSAGVEEVNASCFGANGQPWGLDGIPLEAFKAMWHSLQPQILVRMAGPLGPQIASDYVQKKFGPNSVGGLLSEKEAQVLERYLFHCLAGGGQGAVCNPPPHHSLFFGPGVIAFAPLSQRLDQLEKPIDFVYGTYDWMDWREADKLRPELRRPATLTLIEDAGHHVYLENPEGFLEALSDTLRAEIRLEHARLRPRASFRGAPCTSMQGGDSFPSVRLSQSHGPHHLHHGEGSGRVGPGCEAAPRASVHEKHEHLGPSVVPIRTIWGVWRPGYEGNAVNRVLDRLIEDIVDEFGDEDEDEAWIPPPGSMLAEALNSKGIRDWKGKDIVRNQSHFGLYD